MFFWLLNSCAIKKEKQAGKAKYALEFLSCSVPSLRLYFSVCFFFKGCIDSATGSPATWHFISGFYYPWLMPGIVFILEVYTPVRGSGNLVPALIKKKKSAGVGCVDRSGPSSSAEHCRRFTGCRGERWWAEEGGTHQPCIRSEQCMLPCSWWLPDSIPGRPLEKMMEIRAESCVFVRSEKPPPSFS